MNLVSYGEIKATVAEALGMCATDARVLSRLNLGEERLLNRPNKPVGSMGRFRFCVTESCFTLPRQIRTVEAWALCNDPGIIVPEWHEFLGNGTYLMDEDSQPGNMLVDHGRASTFADVDPGKSVTAVAVAPGGAGYTSAPTVVFTNDPSDTTGTGAAATATVIAGVVTAVTITNSGSGYTTAPSVSFTGGGGAGAAATATIDHNRKIRVVSDTAESAGLEILLQGYDENGQWIRTQDGGTWIDGELVAISAVATNSTKTFTSIVRVVKPVTNGVVRLYSWDNTASINQRALAAYEPSEKLPVYRKMFIPGIASASCEDSPSSCSTKSVTVFAKLQHIPVLVDNDFFVIGNVAALTFMAMAIEREMQNRFEQASHLEQKAINELEGELSSYIGDGMRISIKHVGRDEGGAAVFNTVSG